MIGNQPSQCSINQSLALNRGEKQAILGSMVGMKLKHYEVEAPLGKGGMGEVYRAHDLRLQRPVAVKLLKPELVTDLDRQQRFFREARAAASITHPAIAQIYDVDEADGTIFIAMELVEGRTLRQLINDRELDLESSIEIAIQVAEGLAKAHEKSIVHRDIKSDNIMVTSDGHAKILDFGLAKLLDPQGSGASGENPSQIETALFTELGTVVGTISYMSPEQARGRAVDERSDVFSLGVVIYEMVTGELPFQGDSPVDTMHAIAFEEVRPLTTVRKNLPPELHRIVSRCLRKKPQDRYSTAKHLADELHRLKRDLDSGIQRSLPLDERLREQLEWLKSSIPLGTAGIAVAAVLAALIVYLTLTDVGLGGLVMLAVIGLLIFRWVRNRRNRQLKYFVKQMSKLPDVQAIFVQGSRITLVVDRAEARLYVRMNNLLNTINSKLFHGDPFQVAIRDDLPLNRFQEMLREPGVVYLRKDVLAA